MPRNSLLIPALLLALVSCKRDEGVTVSGNVAGLDTLAYFGDSLLARANRGAGLDSLQTNLAAARSAPGDSAGVVAAGDSRGGALENAPPTPAGNPMSLRAQARGDSMARAAAQRLVGTRSAGASAGGDTVRGIVTLTGVEPARQASLKSGDAMFALSGMATRALPRLEGLDIVIRGIRVSPRDMVVSEFIVRSSRGIPAFDGRLEESNGAWTLRLTDGSGRKRIGSLPSPLRGLSGARVWIAMQDGAAPASYGVIGER